MTTFIVTFNFPMSTSFGLCPMRIDATCAEDAVKACVAAYPGCDVISVKVVSDANTYISVNAGGES